MTSIVYLIDDDAPFRESLTGLLKACGIAVCAYADAQSYLDEAPTAPGCLLLDIRMPNLSGLDLQQRLVATGKKRPIVFLTGTGDIPMTVRALKAGAEDFLSKPVDRDVLLATVHRAFARDAEQLHLDSLFGRLTPREIQVCERLVVGLLNKQIAFDLSIVERTIKAHRHQVMSKTGARSIAELVALYHRWRPTTAASTATQ